MKSLKILTKKPASAANSSSLVPSSFWNNFLENNFHAFPWRGSSIPWPAMPAFQAPAVDVSEDDKEVAIKAEIPGLSEKDLEISYSDGVLYLKGEKKEEKEEKKKNTWHRESWQGSFTRSIPIGAEVDWKKVSARHKDGVLTVTIPKIPGKDNRIKINIQ